LFPVVISALCRAAEINTNQHDQLLTAVKLVLIL